MFIFPHALCFGTWDTIQSHKCSKLLLYATDNLQKMLQPIVSQVINLICCLSVLYWKAEKSLRMIMLTRYMHVASRQMQHCILYFSWYEVLCEVLIWAGYLFLSDFYTLGLCMNWRSSHHYSSEKLELGQKGEPCDFSNHMAPWKAKGNLFWG